MFAMTGRVIELHGWVSEVHRFLLSSLLWTLLGGQEES